MLLGDLEYMRRKVLRPFQPGFLKMVNQKYILVLVINCFLSVMKKCLGTCHSGFIRRIRNTFFTFGYDRNNAFSKT